MSILVLTSDTLIGTPATGNIEYSGQFYGTDSNASRAQIQRITQGTAVASTSGTSIDFTSIPSWVKRITVMMNGVSTSGTSQVQLQIGSGSVTTSGYISGAYTAAGTGATSGFILTNSGATAAANTLIGAMTLFLFNSNTWVANGVIYINSTNSSFNSGISSALSGALDRVRITTVNGTDTFDAGSINILYE